MPHPKSGARPVATEARIFVLYWSRATSSILIWTPLSLWASLKASIILDQTSLSEAPSQFQCRISWWPLARARFEATKGAPPAARAAAAPAVLTKCRRVIEPESDPVGVG